jgi:hypothetical protein
MIKLRMLEHLDANKPATTLRAQAQRRAHVGDFKTVVFGENIAGATKKRK